MKVEKWLEEDGLKKITKLASRDDLSIAQIAKKMRISSRTFYRWLKEYDEIKEAFEEGREFVDGNVETAFFKLCVGFKEKIVKPQKIKRTEYNDDGKKVAEYEEIIDVEEEVYIKPDVTAQKFYLTNRKPDTWRNDTKDVALNGEEDNTGVVMLPEVIPEDVIEAEIVENAE